MYRGSYGEFHKNDDGTGTKHVSLFRRNPDGDVTVESSTLRELAFYRSVRHPNIARCSEIHMSRSSVMIILECSELGDLHHFIASRPTPERLNYVFLNLLYALRFMHNHGIVHGDIKPENIVITDDGAKFIDFGGSLIRYDGKYARGMCTYAFISPEDAVHNIYGPTNDIWALGMVILYCFEHDYRFRRWRNKHDAAKWFRNNTIVDIAQLDAPEFIKTVLGRIFNFDVSKRPTTEDLVLLFQDQLGVKDSGPTGTLHLHKSRTPLHENYIERLQLLVSRPVSDLIKKCCMELAPAMVDPWYRDVLIDDICQSVYGKVNSIFRKRVRRTICWIVKTLRFDLWVKQPDTYNNTVCQNS